MTNEKNSVVLSELRVVRAVVDRDAGYPLYPSGARYERMFVAQGLADGWFANGTVFEDDGGTCWMVYPLGDGQWLVECVWDTRTEIYLLVEEGRQLVSNGVMLTAFEKEN